MVKMPETCKLCSSEEHLTAPIKEVLSNINPFFPITIEENLDCENENRICSVCILDITLLEEVVNKYKTVSSIPEDDKCYLCTKDEITFRVTGELYVPIKVIEESFKMKNILPDDFGDDFWENAMRYLNKRKVCHECYFLIDTTYELYQKVKLIDKDIEDIISRVKSLEYDKDTSIDDDSDFNSEDENGNDYEDEDGSENFEDGSENYEDESENDAESSIDIKDVVNGLKTEVKFELDSEFSYNSDSDNEIDQHAIIRRIKEEPPDEDEIVRGVDEVGQSSVRIKEEPMDNSCDEEAEDEVPRKRRTRSRRTRLNSRIVKNPRNKGRKSKGRRPNYVDDDDSENLEENASLDQDSENDNASVEDSCNNNELEQHSRSRKRGRKSNKDDNSSEETSVRVKTEPRELPSDEDQELDGLDNEHHSESDEDRSERQLDDDDDDENESVDFTQNFRKQKQPSKPGKKKKISKKQSRSKRTSLQIDKINKRSSKHVALNSQESPTHEHLDEDETDKQEGDKTAEEINPSCSWCASPCQPGNYLCLSCNDKKRIAFAGIQSGRTCRLVLVRVKLPVTENSCDRIEKNSEYIKQESLNDVDENLATDFQNDAVESRKRSREHSECSSHSENSSSKKRTKSDFDNGVKKSKSLSLGNESYSDNLAIQNHAVSTNSDCNSSASKKRKRTSSVTSSISSDFDSKSLCSNSSRNTRRNKSSPISAVSSNLTIQNLKKLNSVEQSIDKINIGSNSSQSFVDRNSTEQFQVNENTSENLKSLTPSKMSIHSGIDDDNEEEEEASRNDTRSGNELGSNEENSITDRYKNQSPKASKRLKDMKLKNAGGWMVKLDKVGGSKKEVNTDLDASLSAHNSDDVHKLDSESEDPVVEKNMIREESEVCDQSDVSKNVSNVNACNSLTINSDRACEQDLESETLVAENKKIPEDESQIKADQSDELSNTNNPLETKSDSPSKRDSKSKVVQSCDNITEYQLDSEVDVQSNLLDSVSKSLLNEKVGPESGSVINAQQDLPNHVSGNDVNACSSLTNNSDSPDKQDSDILLGNDSIAGNKSKPDLEVDVPMPDCQESDEVLLNEASYSRESKDDTVPFPNAIRNQSSDVECKNLNDGTNRVMSSESELSDEDNVSGGAGKYLVEDNTNDTGNDSDGHINKTSEKSVSDSIDSKSVRSILDNTEKC